MWNPHNSKPFPHPSLALGYKKQQEFHTALERLEYGAQLLAEIIADDGQQFWPIFERLEQEIEKRKAQDSVLKRALALSGQRRDRNLVNQNLSHKMAYSLAYKFNSNGHEGK